MNLLKVPLATQGQPQLAAGQIRFVDYRDAGSIFRNRVLFECCAFSFVQSGQKQIYRASGNTVLLPGHGMLIPEGNSIIAEHGNSDEHYHSIIVFFPARLGMEFMATRAKRESPETVTAPFIYFETSAYIREYVRNISSLIKSKQQLTTEMAALKVRELLTAMYELAPGLLHAMFAPPLNLSLRNLVENNLMSGLALDELAFLANRSLSSFKRDFRETYGLSPQKYIRERRLEMAQNELLRGKRPSEIHQEFGYRYLSNFVLAYKRKFGTAPGELKI